MVSRLLHLVRLQEDLQVRVCALSCRLRRFFCFLSPQLFVIYVALDMPPFTDCRRASLKRRPRRTLQLCKLDRSLPLLGPTFWRATARTMCLASSTEIRFLRERALVACQRFDAVKCFEDLLPATSAIGCDALQLHQCCNQHCTFCHAWMQNKTTALSELYIYVYIHSGSAMLLNHGKKFVVFLQSSRDGLALSQNNFVISPSPNSKLILAGTLESLRRVHAITTIVTRSAQGNMGRLALITRALPLQTLQAAK